jgi:hypothetical protein
MTTQELLMEEIKKAPESAVREARSFLRFLQAKAHAESFDGLALSRSSLAEDWLSQEEDEAWKDL